MPYSVRLLERVLRHQRNWGSKYMMHKRGLREVRRYTEHKRRR